jgi:hypothetical protein
MLLNSRSNRTRQTKFLRNSLLLAFVSSIIFIVTRGSGFHDYSLSSDHTSSLLTLGSILQPTLSTTSSSYEMASRDSFGFFRDIHESDWKRYKQRFHAESIIGNTEATSNKDPTADKDVASWMMFHMDPSFSCPHLRRVGGSKDGRKWICDLHRLGDDCLVYSVGSHGNYQLEDGLQDFLGHTKCEIHVFDPNPKYARSGDPETKNM